ncbi:UNVERIFIED_CONTAM: hypothetical protein GTU68_019335, partial [Idotea baltica]|nr:hypothetical protein [Idotea baltica]
MGQPAIAITDHGNMHGALQFYNAAKETGIKPIIGCELYVNPVSRFERKTKKQGGAGTYHLTVLAKNLKGYQNLCRLVSSAYCEGFYFKPRVDHQILEEYSEGLIVLSGCLAGEVARLVEREAEKEVKQRIEFYSGIFGEDYYLEVQPHALDIQQKHNAACADFAKSIGVPLVASTDCHYPEEDHHFAQEVLMCISTAKQVTDPDRIKHENVKLHLKSFDEMQTEFKGNRYADEAISNTLRIANACELDFDFSKHYMPRFDPPKGKTQSDVMEELARSGLEKRTEERYQKYLDRLNEELDLLRSMGFAGYFLVVSDFITWAKEKDIPVGPGRGSAAGSLVAYTLRITDVDPILHKLFFERFLNPERVSLPDIDVDFCIYGRDKVIEYVVEKYGEDKVAQIATFGTMKAKAAIKDVGRALGISYAETDRVAQLIPAPRQGFDFNLTESIKMEKRLASYAKKEGKQLIDLALKLEGLTRHTSTHAAGVVIGDRPLVEMLPMMLDKDDKLVTQYAMKYVEKIGLVKFDFLGLKTLTVINTAVNIIKDSQDVELDPIQFPIDDKKTFNFLCQGNTVGVFQLESTGITEITMRLKPESFEDIVAILALYRPGPL